jgi:hypothetical protein
MVLADSLTLGPCEVSYSIGENDEILKNKHVLTFQRRGLIQIMSDTEYKAKKQQLKKAMETRKILAKPVRKPSLVEKQMEHDKAVTHNKTVDQLERMEKSREGIANMSSMAEESLIEVTKLAKVVVPEVDDIKPRVSKIVLPAGITTGANISDSEHLKLIKEAVASGVNTTGFYQRSDSTSGGKKGKKKKSKRSAGDTNIPVSPSTPQIDSVDEV